MDPGHPRPPLNLSTARFDRHRYAPHTHEEFRAVGPTRATVFTYVNPAVAVAAGALFLDERLTPAILASFALPLAGSFLATASTASTASTAPTAPTPPSRPVTWSPRQTSRADGRVKVLTDLPEERPGSTGQGDG